MHLVCDNTARHAKPSITEDGDAAAQGLTATSSVHTRISFIEEGDYMSDANSCSGTLLIEHERTCAVVCVCGVRACIRLLIVV